jgi:hypothetical protein
LLAERGVESESMTRGGDIGGWSAFAQHLLDGISGDEVDEQEDNADYQPDYREGVEDALEKGFQCSSRFSVLSCRWPVLSKAAHSVILSGASSNELAESKDLVFFHARRDRLPNRRSFDCAQRFVTLSVVLRSE